MAKEQLFRAVSIITVLNMDIHMIMNKSNETDIIRLLQIAGGTFPTGGFSQSYGLETYIATDRITNIVQLRQLLEAYIGSTICRNELPLLMESYRACEVDDFDTIKKLNDLGLATKVTRESREAFNKSGKALLRICVELIDSETVKNFYRSEKKHGGFYAYNVVFGVIAQKMMVGIDRAAGAYAFSTVNGLVQAAVKLIPLGNIEGQKLLCDLIQTMGDAVAKAAEISADEISNFMPAMEMASIEHETLPIRLYMS